MLIDGLCELFNDTTGAAKEVDLESLGVSDGMPVKCFVQQDGAGTITVQHCDTSGGTFVDWLTITSAEAYCEFWLPTGTKRYVKVSSPTTDTDNRGAVILDGQTNR